MGIIKLSACGLIISVNATLILISTAILSVSMFAAFTTHIKAKHTFIQMIPSFSLMTASGIIASHTLGLI